MRRARDEAHKEGGRSGDVRSETTAAPDAKAIPERVIHDAMVHPADQDTERFSQRLAELIRSDPSIELRDSRTKVREYLCQKIRDDPLLQTNTDAIRETLRIMYPESTFASLVIPVYFSRLSTEMIAKDCSISDPTEKGYFHGKAAGDRELARMVSWMSDAGEDVTEIACYWNFLDAYKYRVECPLLIVYTGNDTLYFMIQRTTRRFALCLHCGKSCIMRCSRCHIAHYCNRECQRRAWNDPKKAHRIWCELNVQYRNQCFEITLCGGEITSQWLVDSPDEEQAQQKAEEWRALMKEQIVRLCQ